MVQAGLDVARLNFSHGAHEIHEEVVQNIRSIDAELGTNTAILADLQGPKLRVGEMENNGVDLTVGALVKITTEKQMGTSEVIYTNYKEFPADVKPGETILLDDGKLVMMIESTDGQKEVMARVIQGGVLSSKKGLNLPNTKVSLPSLSQKDIEDLHFALSCDVDWIGLSFVRNAADVIALKAIIHESGKHAKVVAKIEKPEAVDQIDERIGGSEGKRFARAGGLDEAGAVGTVDTAKANGGSAGFDRQLFGAHQDVAGGSAADRRRFVDFVGVVLRIDGGAAGEDGKLRLQQLEEMAQGFLVNNAVGIGVASVFAAQAMNEHIGLSVAGEYGTEFFRIRGIGSEDAVRFAGESAGGFFRGNQGGDVPSGLGKKIRASFTGVTTAGEEDARS
jgi:hypothetical protein